MVVPHIFIYHNYSDVKNYRATVKSRKFPAQLHQHNPHIVQYLKLYLGTEAPSNILRFPSVFFVNNLPKESHKRFHYNYNNALRRHGRHP